MIYKSNSATRRNRRPGDYYSYRSAYKLVEDRVQHCRIAKFFGSMSCGIGAPYRQNVIILRWCKNSECLRTEPQRCLQERSALQRSYPEVTSVYMATWHAYRHVSNHNNPSTASLVPGPPLYNLVHVTGVGDTIYLFILF